MAQHHRLQNTCNANRDALTFTCTGDRRPKPRCQCTPVSSNPSRRIRYNVESETPSASAALRSGSHSLLNDTDRYTHLATICRAG